MAGGDYLQSKSPATLGWHPHGFWNGTSVCIPKMLGITVSHFSHGESPRGLTVASVSTEQLRVDGGPHFWGLYANGPVTKHNQSCLGVVASALKSFQNWWPMGPVLAWNLKQQAHRKSKAQSEMPLENCKGKTMKRMRTQVTSHLMRCLSLRKIFCFAGTPPTGFPTGYLLLFLLFPFPMLLLFS